MGKTKVKGGAFEPRELTEDAKVFILHYPEISASMDLARNEIQCVNREIAGQSAKRPWFDARTFVAVHDWRLVQIWDRRWRQNVTPGFPWIHFEYCLRWEKGYVETCLDIEGERMVSAPIVAFVAQDLSERIGRAKHTWLKGGGWLLNQGLDEGRMLLHRTDGIDASTFSSQWLLSNAMTYFGQLSDLIPDIQATFDLVVKGH